LRYSQTHLISHHNPLIVTKILSLANANSNQHALSPVIVTPPIIKYHLMSTCF